MIFYNYLLTVVLLRLDNIEFLNKNGDTRTPTQYELLCLF